ncbi:MAG: response regulator transcription factor [Chloroflexi bacterium]|nr:response regulator transcription factor [Chloroflexota bacterium]
MGKIRLLIVDRHKAVGEALLKRLAAYPEIEVATAVHSVREALPAAARLAPDVILLELKGADAPGADSIRDLLRESAPNRPAILVLTSYAVDVEREQALNAGAHRYLLKQINSDRLMAEIRAAAGYEEARAAPSGAG